MREVLCLHVGQAGIQIGNAIWELLCAEHDVNENGDLRNAETGTDMEAKFMESFFSLSSRGKYVPRAIQVDLEPTVVDEIRNGAYKDLFHPGRIINGPEDSASNFARGFFTVGKLILPVVLDEMRKIFEQAEGMSGIFIVRALGGGTGAGLTAAIMDYLIDYPKLCKVEQPVYPSPQLTMSIVEPYNSLLSEHFCMEDLNIGLLFDNEALYGLCGKYIDLATPTFTSINRIIAQVSSSLTASTRFDNVLSCDLTVLQTNLVPFPRIHFPLCNFAPLFCESKSAKETITVRDIVSSVFDNDNQMLRVNNTDAKYMSCSLLFRGEVSPYHVYIALAEMKQQRNIDFVKWCNTGFKVGICKATPCIIPNSYLASTNMNLTMLANTSSVGAAWQRLVQKFYLLYCKRSFVHWYMGEGMEEREFSESLFNIGSMVRDYEAAAYEPNGGEEEDVSENGMGYGNSMGEHEEEKTESSYK